MGFATLPQDLADQLLQERPVFHKNTDPDNTEMEDLCQCLGLEVYRTCSQLESFGIFTHSVLMQSLW